MKRQFSNRQFNILMLIILIISGIRLINHGEEAPLVLDWCSIVGLEIAVQTLYNNFKT